MTNILSSIAFIAVVASSNAQVSESFTLLDAKDYALNNHNNIKNANYDIEVARLKIVETRGMGLPQIDGSASFQNFINIPVQIVPATSFNPNADPDDVMEFRMGTDYSASATVQVNQLIFNGSYIVGLQAAALYKKVAETSALSTKEDVLFNVIQAYELAAVAKENLVFVDSMVILTEQLVEKQQNYLELGMMVKQDLDQTKFALASVKNGQLSAKLQYDNTLEMLKLAMGYPMDQNIEISESTEDLASQEHVTSGSIANNLNFQLMEQQIDLNALNVRNYQMSQLPSLYGFFQHTYNAYRSEFNFFDTNLKWYPQTLWGIQLNVPIFSGLQRHSQVQQAKVELMKSETSLEQLENGLRFQELQAQNKLLSAKSTYILNKENVDLARTIYDNTVAKQEVGKATSIEVTQAQNQYISAESQYLASLIEIYNAKRELDKIYNNILTAQQ